MKAALRAIRFVLIASALIASSVAAHAQSAILQGGPLTPGHAPMYINGYSQQPIATDSGPAAGGPPGTGLSELGLTARGPGTPPFANAGTGPFGTNFCDYDAPTTNATGYHALCFSPNAQGGGLISYGAYGLAAALPLMFDLNGTSYTFPGNGNCNLCGTIAGQNANNVAITGGTISGLSAPIPIASGGTGATTPGAAVTAIGAAPANYTAAGTGGVPLLVNSVFALQPVMPQEFGAVGNGSTNDEPAIMLADTAAAAAHRSLYFPAAIYAVGSAMTPATGAEWVGESFQNTTLRTTSATADILDLSNSYIGLKNLAFGSAVTRTAGAYVNATGTNYVFEDLYNTGAFFALELGTNVTQLYMSNYQSYNAVPTSGVDLDINGCNDCSIHGMTLSNGSTARPFAHMVINNMQQLYCGDCNVLAAENDLYIDPGASQAVASLKFIGGYLDEASIDALIIVPTSTGSVNKLLFDGTWFDLASGGVADINIGPAGNAVVDWVQCLGCELYANANASSTGIGASQPSGTSVTNIQVLGGVVGGQTTGINFAGITSFQVSDLLCGNHYSAAPTTCVTLSGTISAASLHDVHNSTSATPLANTATITTSNIHNNY